MIANHTDHAANERAFLARMGTGLPLAAFGFFLLKLNVLVEAAGSGNEPHFPEDAAALVTIATRYVGLVMAVMGIAVIAQSTAGFERTRRAIVGQEAIHIARSAAKSLFSAALHDRRGDLPYPSRCVMTFAWSGSDRRTPWT
jgi:putative membrane protein